MRIALVLVILIGLCIANATHGSFWFAFGLPACFWLGYSGGAFIDKKF
jgi:hypothetical protein